MLCGICTLYKLSFSQFCIEKNSSYFSEAVLGEKGKELDGENNACPHGESRTQSFRPLIFDL